MPGVELLARFQDERSEMGGIKLVANEFIFFFGLSGVIESESKRSRKHVSRTGERLVVQKKERECEPR